MGASHMVAAHKPRAFEFHLWLIAMAESNALEGQDETAERLRGLAALVLDHPDEFEAYVRLCGISF